jgi:hypothetical protein
LTTRPVQILNTTDAIRTDQSSSTDDPTILDFITNNLIYIIAGTVVILLIIILIITLCCIRRRRKARNLLNQIELSNTNTTTNVEYGNVSRENQVGVQSGKPPAPLPKPKNLSNRKQPVDEEIYDDVGNDDELYGNVNLAHYQQPRNENVTYDYAGYGEELYQDAHGETYNQRDSEMYEYVK